MGIKLGELVKEMAKEKAEQEEKKHMYWKFIGKSPWLPRRMRIKKVEVKEES